MASWWQPIGTWWTQTQKAPPWPRECRACTALIQKDDPQCPRCGMLPSGKDDLIGQQIGSYKLLERAGQGAYGTTYMVEEAKGAGHYALRLLRPKVLDELGGVDITKDKIRQWSQLSHPHIARLLEYKECEHGFYWLVEWLEGHSLQRLLREHRTGLPPRLVWRLMRQLCEALQDIHEQGFIHGQLRPSHIMLLGQHPHYRVKIFDVSWGTLQPPQARLQAIRHPKQLRAGWYLAPEQVLQSPKTIDRRADIYACGALLFQLLTGSPPFRGSDWSSLQRQHLTTPPPRLDFLHPQCRFSEQLEELIRRSLAKQPQDRFQSIQSFWGQLQSIDPATCTIERRTSSPVFSPESSQRALDTPPPPGGIHLGLSGFQHPEDDADNTPTFSPVTQAFHTLYLGKRPTSRWMIFFWLAIVLGLLILIWDWWKNF
ncbi:MAG: hypothetical protein CL920_11560 [Deltaproteobacteria bacterium]|nr:hypothetical protein [Deltaproteobacteria bacterium]